MQYKGIHKIHQGAFLTRYDIDYETQSGLPKRYEMISRDPSVDSLEALRGHAADAVVLIVTDTTGERLLLGREFRMAVGDWVYNFPAGLIDPGETPVEAAARELREETGLRLVRIREQWAPSYSAVGFSNERTIVIVGEAAGEIVGSDSEMEEIAPRWVTRPALRQLLQDAPFAARTQAYCMLWSQAQL